MAKNPPPSCPSEGSSSEEEDYSEGEDSEEEEQLTTAKPVPQAALDPCADPIVNSATESDDKEGESESGSDDSEDEEQQPGSVSKKSQQPSTPAPPQPAPDSDTHSEYVSESDVEAAKKFESSTPALPEPVSEKPASSKPVAKVLAIPKVGGGSKKSNSELIWRKDDEIVVLKSMAKFQSKHGQINLTQRSVEDFLPSIKGSLSLQEVNADQLLDKLRKLKKKYKNVVSRGNTRKEHKFASTHSRTIYDLGKAVWGPKEKDTGKSDDVATVKYDLRRRNKAEVSAKADVATTVKSVSRKRGKEEVPAIADDVTVKKRYLKRECPFLMVAVAKIEEDMGKNFASVALETVDPKKANILEKKVKKQAKADVKHNMQELVLRNEILKLIMEGIDMAID